MCETDEEQFGTDEAINFRVELAPTGILTERRGTQINFAWPNVEEIKETDDSIDFFMRNGGLVVVRKRAFASTEELRRFLALAAEHRAQPRNFAEPAPQDRRAFPPPLPRASHFAFTFWLAWC